MWGAIAAIGGLILGGISLFTQSKQAKEAQELQEEAADLAFEQQIIDLKRNIAETTGTLATTRLSIAETEEKKTDIERFFELYPTLETYGETEKTEMELWGEEQYRTLRENYGELNVLAGATGRAAPGTSIAVKGQQARGDIASWFGEDLTPDKEGGLFGLKWTELLQGLEAEYTSMERQLGVYETTLEELGKAETEWESVLEESEAQLEEWEKEAGAEEAWQEALGDTKEGLWSSPVWSGFPAFR